VEGLARQRQMRLAQGFVLGGVGVDQLGHVLGVGFPVHDELGFTDLLTHAGADHVDANDGAILLANELDEATGTEDGTLAVAGQVVFLGLHLVVAELFLGGLFGVADRCDFRLAVGDLGDVDVFDDRGVQAGDFLGNENTLLVATVCELDGPIPMEKRSKTPTAIVGS